MDTWTASDLDELIRPGIVSDAVYTDASLFRAEVERIFHRWWVYIGHTSEVPSDGDYCVKQVGDYSLILTRAEGEPVVLHNRCRHRGSTVCQLPRGTANVFRCQYHGWTYTNAGDLVGVPRPDAYENLDKKSLGLERIPRLAVYRGFVFGSLRPDGIPFEEYIGPAAPYIDAFCDASPVGEVYLGAGAQQTVLFGNWKLIGGDGYHAAFTHRSARELLDARAPRAEETAPSVDDTASSFLDRPNSKAMALGRGHVRLHDDNKNDVGMSELVSHSMVSAGEIAEYQSLMKAAWGEEYEDKIANAEPHIEIWPNLQLTDVHVRTMRPISARRTEVEMAPALLAGVPSGINAARVRTHEWFFGPASFGSPDDAEIFARVQRGLDGELASGVYLARGLHRESTEGGIVAGRRSDETTQRGQLDEWLHVMKGAAQ